MCLRFKPYLLEANMMNKLNSHILQLGICIGSIQAIKNNLVKNIRKKYRAINVHNIKCFFFM